ncbi:glycosyltransferase [Lacticaseibacillus paracasei]|uniref:Putative poly(Glycerol-phosphate) alpha-glucosyltransferase n=1 Tax=Lacticaseibacillus paracasei TaxID=1597 RepID=A0A422M9P5_LACPA|nr:glycosyltransferase [Lacticaseibacillus paracasei]MDE3305861.1 glycosyltransferase [Lacticaseibacillus paracasei]RND79597.1 putative poly(glycerol-phosphate) alpha-glucosyltransferase [Lacticaseibacillus paracasei]RND85122.1 putative poly(glycerol-phosphate) alpha-glucosyltransferase [Lacticaseibacillus paracasei]RND87307.1 putative poly(glycerol-phosphate) alpha-glucosyltransferase [Lacticaseibacillus paracasei]RNE15669.1 putative poly(glycerol-phosphate) alpha-glucosyltransferase [Lactica
MRSRNIAWIIWHDKLLSRFSTILPDSADTRQVLRLGDSVRFNDYTNDISQVYEQAQLLILPSRAEGLPLTLVEAQAHGLPIIASDVRYGARDIVNDGKDGFLVENGNVNQLAERIMALLADPAELMKFSEQAYQDSWKYSEEAVWKKWLPLVEDAKKVAEIPESVGAI